MDNIHLINHQLTLIVPFWPRILAPTTYQSHSFPLGLSKISCVIACFTSYIDEPSTFWEAFSSKVSFLLEGIKAVVRKLTALDNGHFNVSPSLSHPSVGTLTWPSGLVEWQRHCLLQYCYWTVRLILDHFGPHKKLPQRLIFLCWFYCTIQYGQWGHLHGCFSLLNTFFRIMCAPRCWRGPWVGPTVDERVFMAHSALYNKMYQKIYTLRSILLALMKQGLHSNSSPAAPEANDWDCIRTTVCSWSNNSY